MKNNLNYNLNIINNEENNKEITLIFILSGSVKDLYLDIEETFFCKDIITQLYHKYLWLKDIEIIDYTSNGIKIKVNKTSFILKYFNNIE